VASPAQVANKQAVVILDGTGSSDSDGDVLTYNWTQTGGPSVALTGATSAKASFIAPRTSGSLTFSLMVNDGKGNSSPATSSVTVLNRVPIAVSGSDLSVLPSAQVTLDGLGSSDPDGDALTWTWTQISGTAVTLAPAGPGKAVFTAPNAVEDLVFSLTTNDGEANSLPSLMKVSVSLSPSNNVCFREACVKA
jgi:hypothetical protein